MHRRARHGARAVRLRHDGFLGPAGNPRHEQSVGRSQRRDQARGRRHQQQPRSPLARHSVGQRHGPRRCPRPARLHEQISGNFPDRDAGAARSLAGRRQALRCGHAEQPHSDLECDPDIQRPGTGSRAWPAGSQHPSRGRSHARRVRGGREAHARPCLGHRLRRIPVRGGSRLQSRPDLQRSAYSGLRGRRRGRGPAGLLIEHAQQQRGAVRADRPARRRR